MKVPVHKVKRQTFSRNIKVNSSERWASTMLGNRDLSLFLETPLLNINEIARRNQMKNAFKRWSALIHHSSISERPDHNTMNDSKSYFSGIFLSI
jgi:hypothetical protein